jgi:hypothetical protein
MPAAGRRAADLRQRLPVACPAWLLGGVMAGGRYQLQHVMYTVGGMPAAGMWWIRWMMFAPPAGKLAHQAMPAAGRRAGVLLT